jgi:hypothetical protein
VDRRNETEERGGRVDEAMLPTSRSPLSRFWPLIAIPVTGYLLWAFVFIGPRPSVLFGIFRVPPLYGYWAPVRVSWMPLLLAAVVTLAAGLFFLIAKRLTLTIGVVLVVLGIFLAFGVGMVRGDVNLLTRNVKTQTYALDLDLVDEYGPREFAEAHPDLIDEYEAYNSKTKPPGGLLLLWGIYEVVGDHALRVAVLVAGIGLSAALVAFAIGRTISDVAAGKMALVLFLTAPGPLLLAFSTMDIVFALFLSAAAAGFIYSLSRDDWRWSAGAGVVLGVATLFNFASAFIAVAAGVTAILLVRKPIRIVYHVAGAALGGVLVLAVAQLTIGIDVLDSYLSYRAIRGDGFPWEPYWVVGQPVAIMIFMGLPILVLGVKGLFRKEFLTRGATFVAVLSVVALIWFALPDSVTGLRRGEMERIWAYFYPLFAGVAGAEAIHWTRKAGLMPWTTALGLGVLSIAQAVYIESLWDTLF